MINELKKFCRKNKFFYFFSRLVYVPFRELRLFRTKRQYRNDAIKKLMTKSEKPRIYFFGVPVHKNLGDLAQTYCIFRYFTKYWKDYEVLAMQTYSTYSSKYRKLLKNKIGDKDIIFFQSGYCTQDEHLDHTMHKIMLQEFPNTRFVFLPQTVLFRNEKEKKITEKIFNQHKHTLFLARDKVSFKYASDMFPNLKLDCFPDIVTTLIGTEQNNVHREGILLCVRNDYEQLYSKDSIQKLRERLEKLCNRVDITDTTCNELEYSYIMEHLRDVIYAKINTFKNYQVIITDRYHGTIFSMIANVPVIVLASNDHKVKTGLDWFKGIYDGTFYSANSTDEAYDLAKMLLEAKRLDYYRPYFEEKYYSKLRDLAEQL